MGLGYFFEISMIWVLDYFVGEKEFPAEVPPEEDAGSPFI